MKGLDVPPKMGVSATSPAVPPPKALVFLESSNDSSGRIVSSAARKTIRSHVMREYRRQQNELTDHDSPSHKAKQKHVQSPRPEYASLPPESPSASLKDKSSQDLSEDTVPEGKIVLSQRRCSVDSQFHLNDVADAFVCAGNSSIDFQSYALFNHYSSECE